ncbi:MAG: transposase [Victivallales bacterium]|nr:transposase [Victivallales bacterium]
MRDPLFPISKEYRRLKQIIERLNRTYKFHTRPGAGFKTFEGAVCLTVLFVAFYNFMRPHSTLKVRVPDPLKCLKGINYIHECRLPYFRKLLNNHSGKFSKNTEHEKRISFFFQQQLFLIILLKQELKRNII